MRSALAARMVLLSPSRRAVDDDPRLSLPLLRLVLLVLLVLLGLLSLIRIEAPVGLELLLPVVVAMRLLSLLLPSAAGVRLSVPLATLPELRSLALALPIVVPGMAPDMAPCMAPGMAPCMVAAEAMRPAVMSAVWLGLFWLAWPGDMPMLPSALVPLPAMVPS